jgi:hypothetical protein
MGIVAGRACPFFKGDVVVLVSFRRYPDAVMASITIVCPYFGQLKVIVTSVLIVTYEALPLCKRLVDRPALYLI